MSATRYRETPKKSCKCWRDFVCLDCDTRKCCKVCRPVSSTLIFVEKPPPDCPNVRSFGEAFFCTCPVRKELYSKDGA